MARIAELSSFANPTLDGVERRRFQLWLLAISVLLAIALGLALLAAFHGAALPSWLDLRVLQIGFLLLVVLFCWYVIEQELQLRRLSRLLIDERILTASLTQRLKEINALFEAGRAVNLDLELRDVLGRIAHGALELLAGRDASVMLRHGERELRTVAMAGNSAARGARVLFGVGVAGQVAATLEPVLVTGTVQRPELPPEIAPLVPPPPNSALCVPLIHRNELLGVLNLNARDGRDYTQHDLRALSVFGEQAASAIAHAKLLEDQQLAATRSHFKSLHDHLTGLPNRALFFDRLDDALRRRSAGGGGVAAMLLDLDDFKRVNDSLGHDAGDQVLTAFADRMRKRLRQGDIVARFGGDEFAILAEGVEGEPEALRAAQRLIASLDEPLVLGEHRIRLRATVGLAICGGEELHSRQLVQRADLALTAAKARGKAQTVVFTEALRAQAVSRFELEGELWRALEHDQLEMYYQPLVRLADSEPVGVEALLRWHHPKRGLLPAAHFVHIAEEIGALPEIDRWALGEACRLAGELPARDDSPPLPVFVNLGPQRLRDPGIVDEVRGALERSGLGPGRLTIEIVESARLDEVGDASQRLAELKALGVRLALDDFGSGYASFGHLQRLAVDLLKIDRMFVEGVENEGGERALVRAIVRLAQALDLEVVAEGIERAEQRDALIELGCGAGQGWFLARPMPRGELLEYLARPRP
jgi:diguanylate cyclase (GGDEF)-like protein